MSTRVSAKVKRSIVLLAAGAALVVAALWLAFLPRDPDHLESLAAQSLEEKEPRRALEALDLAIEQVGGRSPAERARRYDLLSKRGRVNLALLKRPDHALDDFQEAQALEPGDPRAWDNVGAALLDLGRYADAARHFEEASAAFPDRERWFRYTAACAHWRQSREFEIPAEAIFNLQGRPGREHDLDRALELFASSGPYRQSQEEIEATLLRPPRGTAEVRQGFALLLQAREEFVKADRQMADYESSPELAPQFGRVRLEMHRQTGRYYELCRTAELLLRFPPEPRDFSELFLIRTLDIDALRELGRHDAVAAELIALRDMCARWTDAKFAPRGEDGAQFAAKTINGLVTSQFRLIDELLLEGKDAEALAQLQWFQSGTDNPKWTSYRLHAGVVLQRNGRNAEAIKPLEDAAGFVLDPTNDLTRIFGDAVDRRRQLAWLAAALLGVGRTELALQVYDALLEGSPDFPEFLAGRAAAIRARGDKSMWETVVADFELMKLGRDGGRRLATWEADCQKWKGKPAQVARTVAEQSARVLRLFSSDNTTDATTAELVQAAVKARTKGKYTPTAKESAMATAGFALLQGLEAEPWMVLQVYRELVAGRHGDQAYLLLHGLVAAQPAVPDFRLLLARHDLADGRLEDALAILETLRSQFPDDDEVTVLAVATARRLGDVGRAHRIEDAALGDVPSEAALLLAVRGCLADGYAELVIDAARSATVATASGRELLGLAARATLALGDAASAEGLAEHVLAREPAQRDALATLLVVAAARRSDDGSACDAWIAANEALLAALSADALTDIGRALLDAGSATSAEHLLRLALAREPAHPTARLALADSLLLLARYDELDALLEPARVAADDVETTRRLALRALLRDGAAAANSYLADRVATGAPEAELAEWIGLTGAAAGRIGVSFNVLHRRKVALDDDETRFLALCALAWNAKAAETAPLPAVAAVMSATTDATMRDRELDRLLSLDLASPRHELVAAMAPLALLDGTTEFAPLLAVMKERFLAQYPSPGALARDAAQQRRESGDAAGAAALLFAAISADPHDVRTLQALSTCAEALPPEQLDALCEIAHRAGVAPGLGQIFDALRDDARGDAASALAGLDAAANDPQSRADALLVRARLLARAALPTTAPAELPPWCAAGDRERAAAAEAEGDRLLEEAAHAAPADPELLVAIRRRLCTASARIDPPRRTLFVATLIQQQKPWFDAFEAVVASPRLADTAAEKAEVEVLGAALEAALKSVRTTALPLPAVRALIELSERARAADSNELAQRAVARATLACPHHPALLAAKGRIALAIGNERIARRCFTRASLFGSPAADLHHWLGRDALQAARPKDAHDEEVLALTAAPAADHVLRAEMNEVLARASFLLGDGDGAKRAWTAVAAERGEDPARSLPIALETFARDGAVAAKPLLVALAEAPGPAQALAKALLKYAQPQAPKKPADSPRPAKPADSKGGKRGKN